MIMFKQSMATRPQNLICAGTLLSLISAAVVSLSGQTAGQTTGSQQFVVSVAESISITPPAAASLTHDLSGNPQTFAPQDWSVRGNTPRGVTVMFQSTTPFTHTANRNFKRDARLGLAYTGVSGPASWIVTAATDQTNYLNGKETAAVSARSNNPGSATMRLSVTFLTGDASSLLAGNYTTTITGTISANP
jgi:hypothetical protein